MTKRNATVAVIGAGPAGLMAAEALAHGGARVTVYDRMPSVGRKFLMAGRGGLNLTHSEDFGAFVSRYREAAPHLRPALEMFTPADLRACTLLRSYRSDDWLAWLRAAGVPELAAQAARGPQFDASVLMVQAASQGAGVALVPVRMFRREIAQGLLCQPFDIEVDAGRYWLTRSLSREQRPALRAFREWLRERLCDQAGLSEAAASRPAAPRSVR